MTFNKKFRTALILGILVVLAVAYFDILSAKSGIFGSYEDYTNGNYAQNWWNLFKVGVIFLFLIVPITYYFLVKKDKSEAIAIFLTSMTAWWFGLADVFYFLFQGKMIPAVLPWLNNNPIILAIAKLFRFEQVTSFSLILSITVGFIVIVILTKFLEKI